MAKEETKDDGLDKVLSKLDALGTRMDTLESTKKADADDKKADAGKKDETEEEKEEREKKEREEKEDQAKKDAAKKDTPEPEAKKDAKKGDEWPDKDKDKDKDDSKKDATVTVTKKDSDEDEEEKKKKVENDKRRDAAIADAADRNRRLEKQLADQSSEISRLTALMKPRSDDEHAAFADCQAKADSIFQGFGKQAPRPLEGESLINYRKRLATHLKPYSTVWKSVKFSQLPDEAFGIAEAQVYSDAATAASNPVDLNDGELREVSRTDPRTGLKTIVFYGRDSFVKSMGRPGRRVTSFRTQSSGA